MNWKKIIDNGVLLHKFQSNWVVKETQCKIKYFKEFDLDIIDDLVCSIIDINDGSISKIDIAGLLGFNVVDNIDCQRYADVAENDIFEAIIKPVYKWALIVDSIDKKVINLTEYGKRALEKKKKYKFYSASICLFEHFKITSNNENEDLIFPFKNTFGINSDIDKIVNANLDFVFDKIPNNNKLINSIVFQSINEQLEGISIYDAEKTRLFQLKNCEITIHLYKINYEIIPLVYTDFGFSIELTSLLNNINNLEYKNQKILEGQYDKLLTNSNSILDFNSLIKFKDLLNFKQLISDKRLLWSDEKLVDYIFEISNGEEWINISENCDIGILQNNIDSIINKVDWTILTRRADNGFIIKSIEEFPWDFAEISRIKDIDFIKLLLLNYKLVNNEWDWDELEDRLDFNFIKENIEYIDFHLYDITKNNIDDSVNLIPIYPDKKWDWKFISNEYDLKFILSNLEIISIYFEINIVINRIFSDFDLKKGFLNSPIFETLLIQEKTSRLKNYSVTTQNYFWNIQLVDYLDKINYIAWSNSFSLGFECNINVCWTKNIFNKYKDKIKTEKGFDNISKQIEDVDIIINNPSYNWSWDIISKEIKFLDCINFVIIFQKRINWLIAIQHIDIKLIELDFSEFSEYFATIDDLAFWGIFTEKCSIEFIRNHLSLNWNWSILTKKYYNSININAISNEKWIDKWDWLFLSRKFEKKIIIDNLLIFTKYWDWEFLLNNIFIKTDFNLNTFLPIIAECITILDSTKQTEYWQIITRKYTFSELYEIISETLNKDQYKWDFSYFCTHKHFNFAEELDKWIDHIDWSALSISPTLNNFLKFDNSIYSNKKDWSLYIINNYFDNLKYKWDFKQLSKLNSINSNFSILIRYKDKWDWDFLSEYSILFSTKDEKDLLFYFRKFGSYINYNLFSSRLDIHLTINIILELSERNWNWQMISKNNKIKLSNSVLISLKDKTWDWNALTTRKDINLNNDLLLNLIDKDWDWGYISNSNKIIFNSDFVKCVLHKPLNWREVSKNINFSPNYISLSLLVNKDLNWNSICKNELFELSDEVLTTFNDKIDWQLITCNKHIDLNKEEFLNKYKNYLDWDYISDSCMIKLSNEWLNKFKIYINWNILSKRNDLIINENLLSQFKDNIDWNVLFIRDDFEIKESFLYGYASYLNWNIISESTLINFTEKLIDDFQDYWNWQKLSKNPAFIEKLDSVLYKYKKHHNIVLFLNEMDNQLSSWKGFVYHFSHLFNAVDIIKSRKIYSRDKGDGKFSNAAGNLVDRRDTAHNYARFYFRPLTPTQFYNECLGHDSLSGRLKEWKYWDGDWIYKSKWKSYYPQAKNLGLPKCPMPVFFKFDIKEIIQRNADSCYYSNGNMQTNWANIFKLIDNPLSLNFAGLYSTINDGVDIYKEYSQQEFLIKEELDFSNLNSFEIICYDNEQADLLKRLIGFDDPICNKITNNAYGIYHRQNRNVHLETNENVISINSDYKDTAYLSLEYKDGTSINILDGNILKEEVGRIIAYPNIKFVNPESEIEVKFIDESNRQWLIYKN